MVDSQPHPAITSRATASVGLKRPVLLIHVFIVTYYTEVCKIAADSIPKTLSEERGRAGTSYIIHG